MGMSLNCAVCQYESPEAKQEGHSYHLHGNVVRRLMAIFDPDRARPVEEVVDEVLVSIVQDAPVVKVDDMILV